MTPETLGHYRITGLIGQGGMGAVYAAEHALLRRPAAIKVLLPELSRNQEIVTRFFNEARAATAIRHPSIVDIYDFGWGPDGVAYIVMEHLQGESLARRLERGRLAWPHALAIIRQIAGALVAAHGKGIVHRDLKPDNVYLVPDPEVTGGERIKLLDFGIAKLAGASLGATMTHTGAVMGTPTYMAPEQCRGVAVDHRADLYSLGCILFELCAGRTPFDGEGTGDVLAAHIHVPAPRLGNVPENVERMLASLLAKAPADRLQSAQALIHEIDTCLRAGTSHIAPTVAHAARTIAAPPTTLSGASGTRVPPPARRSRPLAFATIAAVLVGAGVIALLARRPAPEVVAQVAPPPIDASIDAGIDAGLDAPLPDAPSEVVVVIESIPPGAKVVHATRVIGVTPLTTTLPAATEDAIVVLQRRGYVERKLAIATDRASRHQITLTKITHAAPAPIAPGRDESVNPFAGKAPR